MTTTNPPVLFHVHGVGAYDFSTLAPEDLLGVQKAAAAAAIAVLPTVYLRRGYLSELRDVLARFAELDDAGEVPNVLGFAIEGPLLGPAGGVPRAGIWQPTAREWHEIAELGPLGLRYVVIAPDAVGLDEELDTGITFADLVDAFYRNGVRLALGHFRHDDPDTSARRIDEVLTYVARRWDDSKYAVVTDHLFNDMPRNFIHAFRDGGDASRRERFEAFLARPWSRAVLPELLGPVPAALLNAAVDQRLTPCLNFDGEHVALEVCRRTVEYLGRGNLMAMTDSTEVSEMAGEKLHFRDGSRLLYRDDEVVAAGTSGLSRQLANMRSIGIDEGDIESLFVDTPLRVLAHHVGGRPSAATEVELAGGNSNVVVKVGDTVRRPVREGADAVHALLRHLEEHGVECVPRFVGIDEKGREILTFVRGIAGVYPVPDHLQSDEMVAAVARMLRRVHDATLTLVDAPLPWPRVSPSGLEPEVICHNDVAPYNVVFDTGGAPVGIIDFDHAGPGPRVEDLAYLAYRFAPLTSDENLVSHGWRADLDRGRRLRLACDAYGLEDRSHLLDLVLSRITELREWILERIAAGDPQYRVHEREDHAGIYAADLRYVTEHREELERYLS